MEKKRKLITAVVLAGLVLGMAGLLGSRYSAEQKGSEKMRTIKIGVSIYDEYDTYISTLVKELGIWAKQKEQKTDVVITLDVQSAGSSQLIQNDQVENFVAREYDVLCIGLVDRTDASGVIDRAKSAGIPIVFFNRELVAEDLERWDRLYYVGADAEEAGNMQGNIIAEACRENFTQIDKNGDGILQYVILEGEPGHQDALVRTENSVKTVMNAGYTMQKLGDEIANWNRAQAATKMAVWLEEFGEGIELVFANNDDMALGALDALENSKIRQYPVIAGVDGIEAGLERVKKKELIGTVYNDYRGQAKAIGELAYALSTGEEIPDSLTVIQDKYVYLPYQEVTYGNVQEFIRKARQTNADQ